MPQVLEIPDIGLSRDEIRAILAEALLEQGIVSLGKASRIAGYSERTFAELLLKKGKSPLEYDESHLEDDIRNA